MVGPGHRAAVRRYVAELRAETPRGGLLKLREMIAVPEEGLGPTRGRAPVGLDPREDQRRPSVQAVPGLPAPDI